MFYSNANDLATPSIKYMGYQYELQSILKYNNKRIKKKYITELNYHVCKWCVLYIASACECKCILKLRKLANTSRFEWWFESRWWSTAQNISSNRNLSKWQRDYPKSDNQAEEISVFYSFKLGNIIFIGVFLSDRKWRGKKLVKKGQKLILYTLDVSIYRFFFFFFFVRVKSKKSIFFMDIKSIALQWSCFSFFFIHSVGQFKLKHSHQYQWNLTEISTFFVSAFVFLTLKIIFIGNKTSDNFDYNTTKRRIKEKIEWKAFNFVKF